MINKEEIQRIYKEKGYTTTQVANILNISRRSLYNLFDGKMSQEKSHNYIKLIVHLKPLYNTNFINQEPKLDSNVEEAIEYIHQSHHATHHNQVLTNEEFMDCKNTIKQHIYAHIGYKAIAHKLQSKLNAISEVVENDILISMLNEEDIHYSDISTIQNILKGETKWKR